MAITEGLRATTGIRVHEQDTAEAMGSGDVPVLATPRVLALAEAATLAAVTEHLDEERTTVGTDMSLTHSAATPVGARVQAEATLRSVDGKHLLFDVTVTHNERTVAHGTVARAVVNRRRFLAAATE